MARRDPTVTRDTLLNAAESLVLSHGFAGAGVAAITAGTGLTRGAFFHHFPTKQALAEALIERWALGDAHQLDTKLSLAERLTSDPVQQLVVFVGLFAEEAEQLERPEPGCLFGAFSYQEGLLGGETWDRITRAMLMWRGRLRGKLDEACAVRSPTVEVDLDSLADMITVLFEGAFIMSRATGEAAVLGAQLRHLQTYLGLLFAIGEAPRAARSVSARTSSAGASG